MARILLVKPLFPYPPHQGTRRVSLAFLADLAGEHEVTYLCQRETRAEAADIPKIEQLGVRVIAPLMPNHRSPVHKLAHKIRNLARSRSSGIPALCYYWSNRVLRGELERLMRDWKPDLTILENWETFRLRDAITTGRAALLAHDAAFQIREREAEASAPNASLAAAARKYKELEVGAWSRFPAILCLTGDDEAVIKTELAAAGASALVQHLPVPVSGELFKAGRPSRPGKRVGFMGSFRADFNLDALSYITDEIWPRVRKEMPDAQLLIAGNGYEGELKARAQAVGGQWLGFVDDLAQYFADLDLLMVPLRFGGGVRIRILEALAAGLPTLATPIAVAGLPLESGKHVCVAPDADGIAREIQGLLADPERARVLGETGRDWCRAQHSPEVLRPKRLAAVARILDEVHA